ncbi:hypothetical protein [Streptomyces sp. AC512_CC834]|uniref:hypothetical protein n=1 Tax=Streptomyces sp. AC512_CC834 TaxID=2823691 RepID=UPI001C275D33|nr:hypothetical protein [Streptomyces sp. AC512_CC834]
MCALTSFAPFRDPADVHDAKKASTLVTRLKEEHGIVIRSSEFPVIGSAKQHQTLRISTHLFHQKRDVERLVDALWRLSREMS